MLMPPAMFANRLYWKVTFSTTHQVHAPLELRGVRTIAHPGWSFIQWFSKTLPSTNTLRAAFSSNRFFTIQAVPADVGTAPGVPDAPLSKNSGVVTRQKTVWVPGERPYTWYSAASGTGSQRI